jgi:hypothetical protein
MEGGHNLVSEERETGNLRGVSEDNGAIKQGLNPPNVLKPSLGRCSYIPLFDALCNRNQHELWDGCELR